MGMVYRLENLACYMHRIHAAVQDPGLCCDPQTRTLILYLSLSLPQRNGQRCWAAVLGNVKESRTLTAILWEFSGEAVPGTGGLPQR